jgi:hypothetical protein
MDFLYAGKNLREDDVIAEDYFEDPAKWPKVRPAPTELLKEIHGRVGKEIAHLTYKRLEVADDAKQWPFIKIADEINVAFDVFLKNVPRDCLNLGLDWTESKRYCE